MFCTGSAPFCSRFELAFLWRSFTVTHVSVNATSPVANAAAQELSCDEAAHLLGTSAEVLRTWSLQLAFPTPAGAGQEATYRRDEVEALRGALASNHSVEGAVRDARRRLVAAG